MNQEDILKMAREAGVTFKPMTIEGVEYEYRYVECNDNIGGDEAGCIERFAALVAAKAAQDEREACLDIRDGAATPDCGGWTTEGIADTISARGQ